MTGFSENASDFEKLNWAIKELERREKVEVKKIVDIRRPVNAGLTNRLS